LPVDGSESALHVLRSLRGESGRLAGGVAKSLARANAPPDANANASASATRNELPLPNNAPPSGSRSDQDAQVQDQSLLKKYI
jgi:hypothetical protein